MMLSKTNHGSVSFLVCSVLFFVILFFGHSIYNSGDDVYLLYLIGGGFGEAPTNLLHYNFGMHPWLGWFIKNLFIRFPDINWYSIVLYILHFISCWILLRLFLSTRKFYEAITIFFLAFFVFEAQFLLNLTFSNTALIVAVSGILLLLHESSKTISDKKIIAASIVLIIISTMLRLHTLIPLALISAPIMIYRLLHNRLLLFCSICIACIAIFSLNYFQQKYYSNKISGWKTEEVYRQTALSYYNISKRSQTAESGIAKALLDNGLFWDKEFLSVDKILQVIKQTHITSALTEKNFEDSLHWLFINSRIFWLALLSVLILSTLRFNKTDFIVSFSCLIIMLFSLAYLLLFKKLPFYLVLALILFYILLSTILFGKENESLVKSYNIFKISLNFLFIATLAWSMIRIKKTISLNKEKNELFVCAWKELNAHPDKLFIATDDYFPMDFFSVWGSPKKFLIKNLLYKDQWLNNTDQPIYDRFSVTTSKDFINNPKIFFAGKKITEIENYYKKIWDTDVHFAQKDSSFSCIDVRRLEH